MKTKIILIISLLLFSGCNDKLKKEVSDIKSNMATKSDIASLQKQIDDINQKVEDIKSKQELKSQIVPTNEINSSLVSKVNNLQKEINEINSTLPLVPKNVFYCKGHFKPTTFITVKKAKIYNSKGKVVAIWPKCTSFTSYIEKNKKLRITGIFVHLKWQNALNKDWWIDIKNVAKKFKDKNESKNLRDN